MLSSVRGMYVLLFVLGAASVFGAQQLLRAAVVCDEHFSLLNPDVICDGREERSEWDYEPLRQKLLRTIEEHVVSGSVPHIALFFRDLRNGPRFAIRENETFDPASLLKIPIMMVILHEADRRPEFLDERLTYDKEYGKGFINGPPQQGLRLHESYAIRELLEKMIVYSDNEASYLLLDKINALGLRENSNTFSDLGTMALLMSRQLDNTRLISIVNIFVALYNSNYLSPQLSQFALDLLTNTEFANGIAAGVPKDVRVAHKFGIRFGVNDAYGVQYGVSEESELHDCGIVYHPSTPYVLCVLTAGADIETASAAIRDISKIVYEEVDDGDEVNGAASGI